MFDFSYCETDPWLFIDHPANTLSNGIFFIIAAIVFALYYHDKTMRICSFLIAGIGLGSSIWHFVANPNLLALDIGTISIFTGWFLWHLFHNIYKKHASYSLALIFIFFASNFALGYLLEPLLPMRTGGFLVPAVAIFILGLKQAKTSTRIWLMLSSLSLLIAMGFRILDIHSCEIIAIGTHFLWHIFAGLALIGPVVFLVNRQKENAPL